MRWELNPVSLRERESCKIVSSTDKQRGQSNSVVCFVLRCSDAVMDGILVFGVEGGTM